MFLSGVDRRAPLHFASQTYTRSFGQGSSRRQQLDLAAKVTPAVRDAVGCGYHHNIASASPRELQSADCGESFSVLSPFGDFSGSAPHSFELMLCKCEG